MPLSLHDTPQESTSRDHPPPAPAALTGIRSPWSLGSLGLQQRLLSLTIACVHGLEGRALRGEHAAREPGTRSPHRAAPFCKGEPGEARLPAVHGSPGPRAGRSAWRWTGWPLLSGFPREAGWAARCLSFGLCGFAVRCGAVQRPDLPRGALRQTRGGRAGLSPRPQPTRKQAALPAPGKGRSPPPRSPPRRRWEP